MIPFRTCFLTLSVSLSMFSQAACAEAPVRYKVKVVNEYPHDRDAYTQGLFFHEGTLYESTGQYGKSSIRTVDLKSGGALRKVDFKKKYFGEGSCIVDGKLFILTWTNKIVFIYDPDSFEYVQSYSYPREGWGLTSDGKNLIASDGSASLYFMDTSLKLTKKINVTYNGKPVRLLNELEWIDGKIWANVYTSDVILIIDPSTGKVCGVVDCSSLLPDKMRTPDTDVLNGIAYNPKTGRIYVTGKNWPRLYEISLVKTQGK